MRDCYLGIVQIVRLITPVADSDDEEEARISSRDFGTWSGEIQVRGTTPGAVDLPSPCPVEGDFVFDPTWTDEMCAVGTDVNVVRPPLNTLVEFVDLCERGKYAWVDGEDGELFLVLTRPSR